MATVHRVLRTVRGFSQAQIAKALGKNDAADISRLESGQEYPQVSKLGEIEYVFAGLGDPFDPAGLSGVPGTPE